MCPTKLDAGFNCVMAGMIETASGVGGREVTEPVTVVPDVAGAVTPVDPTNGFVFVVDKGEIAAEPRATARPLLNCHVQFAVLLTLASCIGNRLPATTMVPIPLTLVLFAASSIAGKDHSVVARFVCPPVTCFTTVPDGETSCA